MPDSKYSNMQVSRTADVIGPENVQLWNLRRAQGLQICHFPLFASGNGRM